MAVDQQKSRVIAGKDEFLLLAGRLVLGLIFMYASYAKLHFDGAWHLRDYHFLFAFAIDSYQMYPPWIVDLARRGSSRGSNLRWAHY